ATMHMMSTGLAVLISGLSGPSETVFVGELCGLVMVIGFGMLIIFGANALTRFQDRFTAFAGAILAIIFGTLAFFAMILGIAALTWSFGASKSILLVYILITTIIALCYLLGGIGALIALLSQPVKFEFERRLKKVTS